MANRDEAEAFSEQLDRFMDGMGLPEGELHDPRLDLAAALRDALQPERPTPEFRARLKAELLEQYNNNVLPFPNQAPTIVAPPHGTRRPQAISRVRHALVAVAMATAAAVALLVGYSALSGRVQSPHSPIVTQLLTSTPTPSATPGTAHTHSATPRAQAETITNPPGPASTPVGLGLPAAQPSPTPQPGSQTTKVAQITAKATTKPDTLNNVPTAATMPAHRTTTPLRQDTGTPRSDRTPVTSPKPTSIPSATVATSSGPLVALGDGTARATATNPPTASPVPPTATVTSPATAPPSATATPLPSATASPTPPASTPTPTSARGGFNTTAAATRTATAVPPSATPSPLAPASDTPAPARPTATATPVPPRSTATFTPPPATTTSVPPSHTPTVTPRATGTSVPATSTPRVTDTSVPATATRIADTATATALPHATATERATVARPSITSTPTPRATASRTPVATLPEATETAVRIVLTTPPTMLALTSPSGTPRRNSIAASGPLPTSTPTGTPVPGPAVPVPGPANAGPSSPLSATQPLTPGVVLQPGTSTLRVPSLLPVITPITPDISARSMLAAYHFIPQQIIGPAESTESVTAAVTLDHRSYQATLQARSYGYQLRLALRSPLPSSQAATANAALIPILAHEFLFTHLGINLLPDSMSTIGGDTTITFTTSLSNTYQNYQVAGASDTLTYSAGGVLKSADVQYVDDSSAPVVTALSPAAALDEVAHGNGLYATGADAVPDGTAVVTSTTILYVPVAASTGNATYLEPMYRFTGVVRKTGMPFAVYVPAIDRSYLR